MEVVHLTRTELLVLRELTTGQTLAKVAGTTFTSVNTIKTHVRSIYRKLGVGSRAEAIARARELGLLK
ncbi:response regulator transcription factor [Acidipropionibacterium acidipropionici]